MNKITRGRSIDTIFVLIVFSIFAFSVLMVLMLGASIYRNINDISREGQYERTVLSYVRTKTKNFDDAGSITVDYFNGVSALRIDEIIGNTEFRTVIYNHDGWLLELFSEAALDFSLGDGSRIARVGDMSFEQIDHGLIKVNAGDLSLLLSPRSDSGLPIGSLEGSDD